VVSSLSQDVDSLRESNNTNTLKLKDAYDEISQLRTKISQMNDKIIALEGKNQHEQVRSGEVRIVPSTSQATQSPAPGQGVGAMGPQQRKRTKFTKL